MGARPAESNRRIRAKEIPMPLDPQASAFLKQAAESGAPPLESLPVAQAREFLRALFIPGGPREAIKKVENRVIDAGNGRLPVRIFTPDAAGPLPILVFFHGGGWVLGDCESYDIPCRALANGAGCIVVSVEYRLAPEHKFPAAPEDCYAAAVWTVRNAGSIGGDPARVAIGGDSAGGNLAAAVAQMARDRGTPPLSFQLLIYPVTNCAFDTPSYRANADGYLLTKNAMEWFWGHYLASPSDGAKPYASPLRASTFANLPPALLITAEYDPLRDEGAAYGARLKEAGVKVLHSDYAGTIHGFFSLPHILDQGKKLHGEIFRELRKAFAG
jgi:acetyl esterase